MRFPRQAKIFRGQLDVAPVAGMVLLLVIFMLLSTKLYTPGVLVRISNSDSITAKTIMVTRDGHVSFGTNVFGADELDRLRAVVKGSGFAPPFELRMEPGSPAKLGEAVSAMFQIRLPEGSGSQIGTDKPTVVVAVNFLGQYFYDNGIVEERKLKEELKSRVAEAMKAGSGLALVVLADRDVNFDAVTRLERWAGEVGISDVTQAERATDVSRREP